MATNMKALIYLVAVQISKEEDLVKENFNHNSNGHHQDLIFPSRKLSFHLKNQIMSETIKPFGFSLWFLEGNNLLKPLSAMLYLFDESTRPCYGWGILAKNDNLVTTFTVICLVHRAVPKPRIT